jgi:chromosome segregation ATPase
MSIDGDLIRVAAVLSGVMLVSMDMERTMNFIVENLASVTVRQDRAENQIEAIRKLVVTGMKMMVGIQKAQKRNEHDIARLTKSVDGMKKGMDELREAHKELAAELRELAASQKDLAESQKKTDRRFDEWLSANRGSNGHKGGNGGKKKPN